MSYIPNLLPEHSKVNLKIDYSEKSQQKEVSKSNLLNVISYIASIVFFFAGLLSILPMFPLGLLFVVIGLLFLPPAHKWIEKSLRFQFTVKIKAVLIILVFIPILALSGITISKVQRTVAQQRVKAEEKKQLEDKEKKLQEEKDQQAKIDSEKSEKLRKDSLHFYNKKADEEFKKNKYLTGISSLNNALRFASPSDHNDIYIRRATNYYKAGKYKDAEKDYSRLIQNGYDHKNCYYQRALCYQKQNKKREAVSDLKKSMKLGNPNAEKLYNKLNPIRRKIVGSHTLCCDGSTSYSTGRGTCSHHGGVCGTEYEYEEYREYE